MPHPNTDIREARAADWPAIWPIVREVARAGETFAYDPELEEATARADWMTPAPARVVVAEGDDRAVVGVANMYANRPGPGSHVASGSLIVARSERGRGLGAALVRDMIGWARARRFAAIQFNAVVATNEAAIRLYERFGFVTIGVVPGAFEHPREGRVGLAIMWLDLQAGDPADR